MEFLNGPYLYDSMYAGDPEAARLTCLPGLNTLLDSYPFSLSTSHSLLCGCYSDAG